MNQEEASDSFSSPNSDNSSMPGRGFFLLFLFSLLLLISGVTLLILTARDSGIIKEFAVEGNVYLSDEEVIGETRLQEGDESSDTILDEATELLEEHSAVLSAKLRLRGNVLYIDVEERKCLAILKQGNNLIEVDQHLTVLSRDRIRCGDIPLVSGSFALGDSNSEVRLKRVLEDWHRIHTQHPELASRVSEIRLNRDGGLTLFSAEKPIRIEMSGGLGPANTRRLYGAFSYMEEHGSTGVIDLRGQDALILPGP